MADYADLEIGLHAREGITWRAELRFSQPRTDADIRLDSKGPVVTLDPDALRMLAEDEEEYGKALVKRCSADRSGRASASRRLRPRARASPCVCACYRSERFAPPRTPLGNDAGPQ